jgi:RNA polymerase sigma factor (sigma-70 family)
MRAFAQRRLRSVAAEDFAQDALVLLLEALREKRIQEPAKLAGFAIGICRNLARERARLGERRGELLAQFGVREEDLVNDGTAPDFTRAKLEDCYSQLTDRARRVIRATFCDDENDGEIADTLELTVSNVRVTRHRTLAALRTCLEGPISWVQNEK